MQPISAAEISLHSDLLLACRRSTVVGTRWAVMSDLDEPLVIRDFTTGQEYLVDVKVLPMGRSDG